MKDYNWFTDTMDWFTLHPFAAFWFVVFFWGCCYLVASKVLINTYNEK